MRTYRVDIPATALTAAIDLLEINPAVSQMLKLLEVKLWQTTELGDAQDEVLPITLVTGFTSSGNGTSVTAVPDEVGDVFGGTCEYMGATQASGGTTVSRSLGGFKLIAGEWLWLPVPLTDSPAGIWIPYNTRAVIRTTAPADSVTIAGYAKFGTVGAL
jgi:hypothetical protein